VGHGSRKCPEATSEVLIKQESGFLPPLRTLDIVVILEKKCEDLKILIIENSGEIVHYSTTREIAGNMYLVDRD
jgi:hypothetical protein